ncbi:hypothetical protein MUP77_09360 [Candidatus Bathyarchaeota archaeon]|nr:hypothetical protein [Candidatus Bathyarchaeota archaeon]
MAKVKHSFDAFLKLRGSRQVDPSKPLIDQLVEFVEAEGGFSGVGVDLPGFIFGMNREEAVRLLAESGRVEFSTCGRVVRIKKGVAGI